MGLRWAGEDPRIALRQQAPTQAELAAIRTRLNRLDAASSTAPWTRQTLAIIDRSPEVRAPDLAAELGRATASFKRDSVDDRLLAAEARGLVLARMVLVEVLLHAQRPVVQQPVGVERA